MLETVALKPVANAVENVYNYSVNNHSVFEFFQLIWQSSASKLFFAIFGKVFRLFEKEIAEQGVFMLWNEFYEHCDNWSESTLRNRISQLKSFGPPTEVADTAACFDENNASRLIKKALTSGVRFTAVQIEELIVYVDAPTADLLVSCASTPFTREQLEDLESYLSEDVFEKAMILALNAAIAQRAQQNFSVERGSAPPIATSDPRFAASPMPLPKPDAKTYRTERTPEKVNYDSSDNQQKGDGWKTLKVVCAIIFFPLVFIFAVLKGLLKRF